jgi:hypothetical protein
MDDVFLTLDASITPGVGTTPVGISYTNRKLDLFLNALEPIPTPVPEPSTFLLLVLGLGLLVIAKRVD